MRRLWRRVWVSYIISEISRLELRCVLSATGQDAESHSASASLMQRHFYIARSARRFLGVMLLLATASGCNYDDTPKQRPVGIDITPKSLELVVGQTVTISATVRGVPPGPRSGVLWRTDSTQIADVTPAGSVSARAVGVTKLIARSSEDTSVQSSIVVTVRDVSSTNCTTISPAAATIAVGGIVTMNAALLCSVTETAADIRWSVSNPNLASVSDRGIVLGRAPGYVNVIATSVTQPTISISAPIEIVTSGAVRGLTVSPTSFVLSVCASRLLDVSVDAGVIVPRDLLITSRDTVLATVAGGQVRGEAEGLVTIDVQSAADPSARGSVTADVRDPAVAWGGFNGITRTALPSFVDPKNVSGTVSINSFVFTHPLSCKTTARFELSLTRLGLPDTILVSASAPSGGWSGTTVPGVAAVVNTAARDAKGNRLFPNGDATLTGTITGTRGGRDVKRFTQGITINNP